MSENRNTPPADDLRSLIAAAAAENIREPASPPPPVDPPLPSQPVEPAAEGEPRLPMETPPAPADKPLEQEAPTPAEGEDEPPRPAAAPEAPQNWSETEKTMFNALPAAARGPFLELHKTIQAGLTPKLQRGAQLEKDYGELDRSVFIPEQRRLLAEKGQSVASIINAWANVERTLGGQNTTPQARDDMIARIIHNYQANPVEIARRLNELRGFAAQPPAGDGSAAASNGGTAPQGAPLRSPVDPELAARLDRLEYENRTRTQTEQNDRVAAAQRQIETFANEIDESGQLAHPFYAEVETEMTGLAQLDRAMGKAPDLNDLYNRAVWANPETREKQLALQRAAEAKRLADERKAKAEQARRAGSSITGAPNPGTQSTATSDLTLRDQIKANMATGPQTSGGRGRI